MPNLRNGSIEVSNPGSLDYEAGILPLSDRAPQMIDRLSGIVLSSRMCFIHLSEYEY